ncbi:hypothetical protein Cgig2_033523 [Carnegiea gigantea]|uniref:Uncharacterized protein n=1 Tax=Carnegiea gigantea TaxID=171969 RepID=A0A9Q1GNI0_9CARY|nr:hypothetical protein Cgig2_033523 [Carnegiea gigantea]
MFITHTSIYVYRIIMYVMLQNLRNMVKSRKIVATTDCFALKSSATEYEKQRASEEDSDYMPLEDEGPDNAAAATMKASMIQTREPGIPLIITTFGGNNDSAHRQSRRASKEDGDYMPLEDEGPDNIAAAATKASKSRTTTGTRTIRTTTTSRQANDVMLSPIDIFDRSSQQVQRDNAAPSSVR